MSPARGPLQPALLAAAALGLAGCGGERPVTAPVAVAAGERMVLREQAVADLKPVAATVTPRNLAEARARIGGTLVRLAVKEGDRVRQGQLVGLIEDQRLRYETRAFDAQVTAAGAEAARAGADLDRIERLYRQGVYAKARLEQAQAAARAAESGLAAARAQRAASAEASAQGAVLAPAAGRVLRADAPAGTVVAPGQSIATITAGELLLRLEIPEARAAALRAGDRVPVEPDDLADAAREGVITQVYPAVTAGRVAADIRVAGLTDDLVGRRVRVKVKVGERAALVIPARFVATRYGVDFVRVAGPRGATSEAPVQLAPGPRPGEFEVLSGLRAGDTVLAAGRGG